MRLDILQPAFVKSPKSFRRFRLLGGNVFRFPGIFFQVDQEELVCIREGAFTAGILGITNQLPGTGPDGPLGFAPESASGLPMKVGVRTGSLGGLDHWNQALSIDSALGQWDTG